MFNDDELEGCPSVQMEEWLQKNEERIRALVPTRWYDAGKDMQPIIQLLIECWDAKRCPYA